MRTFFLLALSATAALGAGATSSTEVRAKVEVLRVPNGGIQPEIAVDSAGVAHMVYLAGEPGAANVFYVRTTDGGKTFTPAVRVNGQDGSAIADSDRDDSWGAHCGRTQRPRTRRVEWIRPGPTPAAGEFENEPCRDADALCTIERIRHSLRHTAQSDDADDEP
jgi:hypothetical protein